MKVRYEPMPDRIATYSVWLVDRPLPWLLGFVRSTGDGWNARRRAEPEIIHTGFKARSDAAAFLAVDGKFAQPRPRQHARRAGRAA